MSKTTDPLLAQGSQLLHSGRLQEALILLNQAVVTKPADLEGHFLLALCEFRLGNLEAARKVLEHIIQQAPKSVPAWMLLSVIHRQAGQFDFGADYARKAVKLDPHNPAFKAQLGYCLLEGGHPVEACSLFESASRQYPLIASLHEGYGRSLRHLGRFAEACKALKKAATLAPSDEGVHIALIETLLDDLQYEEAYRVSSAFLKHHRGSGIITALAARSLMDQNRGAEALVASESALSKEPSHPGILAAHGTILQHTGRIEEAQEFFDRSIELAPVQGFAYFASAYNRRSSSADISRIETMEALAANRALPDGEKIHLHYGLGKAYQDLGKYQDAMHHFDLANQLSKSLRFGSKPYDKEFHREGFALTKRILTRQFIADHQHIGSRSERPIFIIGMMRSGTTLVEQVLSCHSEIGAAGEQLFWMNHRAEAFVPNPVHPDGDRILETGRFQRLICDYLSILESVVPNKTKVVDKMMVNYSILGLIHLAFPRAKIIHVTRNPLDTCLSIYTTPNRSRIEWVHEKDSIVFAYRQYLELMEHWRGVMPPGSIHEVRYEELVLNRETITRRLIEFVGLPWEDACLFPERNDRNVLTSSVWQVRQPVYSASINRWKPYEPYLGTLLELLTL